MINGGEQHQQLGPAKSPEEFRKLANLLILNYLQQNNYTETAKCFLEEWPRMNEASPTHLASPSVYNFHGCSLEDILQKFSLFSNVGVNGVQSFFIDFESRLRQLTNEYTVQLQKFLNSGTDSGNSRTLAAKTRKVKLLPTTLRKQNSYKIPVVINQSSTEKQGPQSDKLKPSSVDGTFLANPNHVNEQNIHSPGPGNLDNPINSTPEKNCYDQLPSSSTIGGSSCLKRKLREPHSIQERLRSGFSSESIERIAQIANGLLPSTSSELTHRAEAVHDQLDDHSNSGIPLDLNTPSLEEFLAYLKQVSTMLPNSVHEMVHEMEVLFEQDNIYDFISEFDIALENFGATDIYHCDLAQNPEITSEQLTGYDHPPQDDHQLSQDPSGYIVPREMVTTLIADGENQQTEDALGQRDQQNPPDDSSTLGQNFGDEVVVGASETPVENQMLLPPTASFSTVTTTTVSLSRPPHFASPPLTPHLAAPIYEPLTPVDQATPSPGASVLPAAAADVYTSPKFISAKVVKQRKSDRIAPSKQIPNETSKHSSADSSRERRQRDNHSPVASRSPLAKKSRKSNSRSGRSGRKSANEKERDRERSRSPRHSSRSRRTSTSENRHHTPAQAQQPVSSVIEPNIMERLLNLLHKHNSDD